MSYSYIRWSVEDTYGSHQPAHHAVGFPLHQYFTFALVGQDDDFLGAELALSSCRFVVNMLHMRKRFGFLVDEWSVCIILSIANCYNSKRCKILYFHD
jgi:hypothetical protein